MLSIIFSILLSGITHPLYISMTEVEYNSNTQNLEISVRIFTDDFESVLRKDALSKIDLSHPTDKKSINEQVKNYILHHLSIIADGKALGMQYVGYEINEESTWVYFETPIEKGPNMLSMQNKILYDFSTTQINLVHVKIGKNELTEKLSYPDYLFSFQF